VTEELNEYECVFYTKRGLELERETGIRALNPMEAERVAWQHFDDRHAKEQYYRRSNYNISVRGPGQ
jgi:hypothetical protein